ncbi:glycosyltransferase [Marinilactibacillus psychrotolerans]|uniref:Glycosyltransferase family 1 protein n=1 Tax=Marinilactibacillus psychrotolerans TaxID=191770 RepID=A0A5R9C0Q4_9LACT|nr:glycosyltransferase [Marinilactibacillus psychrotolerans]TLQ06271.1 glycosyltransferase family 1 protein [Marinilactibacillus psychrotolerans]
MKTVKVLHILKNIQRGGVEQFILNQYKILSNRNLIFDLCVFGPDNNINDSYMIAQFEKRGSHIYYLPYPNKKTIDFMKAFVQLLNTESYDAVHCHQNLFSGVILPLAAYCKVPIRIAHAHTAQERKKTGVLRSFYTQLMRFSINKFSTHRLGASQAANQFVYGNYRQAEFLPNGIELTSFQVEYPHNLRKKLNLEETSILIGHIGSFKPMKNHAYLLKVFEQIQRVTPQAHLVLVGDGKLRPIIENKVKELNLTNTVNFLGNQSEIASLLAEFDVFLFPSIYEGLGLAVIEAQAAGIPSIISDSLPSEIDLGLGLVEREPLNNLNAWVKTVEKTIHSELPALSVDERLERIKEMNFDNQSSAKKLLEIYENR